MKASVISQKVSIELYRQRLSANCEQSARRIKYPFSSDYTLLEEYEEPKPFFGYLRFQFDNSGLKSYAYFIFDDYSTAFIQKSASILSIMFGTMLMTTPELHLEDKVSNESLLLERVWSGS